MSYQEHLSPRSALLSKANRRRQEENIAKRRSHAALVEAMQKGPPKRNGAAQPDSRRQALAAAIERVREVEAELEAARRAAQKKQQEGWEASDAIQAAKGIVTEAVSDYDSAGRQKARDEAKRYLEDAEARHAQWIVDKELGRPVGKEPPTVEQIKAKVTAAEAKVEEIDAIRARLEAEVRQRESDLASEKRKLSDAVGRVLLPVFIDLVEHYRSLQDPLAHVKQHLSLLHEQLPT
jgi:hypothetical protein